MIGKIICNRYEILDHLGTGGMATVWLGYDPILDRKVAIKTFKIDSNDEDAVKRFNREAKAVTTLSHENVVSIYDVENEDNFYYLILEYVEGMTLRDYMVKNPKMSIEEVIYITRQIAAGLSHAHQNGIVHRDIKPQNILLTSDLTCKITDFGIARAYGDTTLTQTNQMLGTVYYLSPEQARGNVATAQSDIYSLGILMFEMLTGKLPFRGESAVAIALKHLQEDLPDIDKYRTGVPQSIKNIVLQATMKNPNERYISSKELYTDLETCMRPDRLNENKYVGFKIPEEKFEETQYVSKPLAQEKDQYYEEDDYYEDYDNNYERTRNMERYASYDEPKKKKSKTKHIILALLAVVGIVVASFFAYNYIVNADSVSAPDVKNMDVSKAKTEITKAGLVVGEVTEVASDSVKENIVIDSDPKAGKKVKKGSTVDLTVSSGKSTIEMPNYVGEDETTAKKSASKLGFKNVTVEKAESNTVEEGKVSAQNIKSGTEIKPKDEELIITVSTGKAKVKLPNLVGKTLEEAYALARQNNFTIVVSSNESSDKYAEGQIISQNPDAKDEVEQGGEVKVVVSKGSTNDRETTRNVTFRASSVSVEKGQTLEIYVSDTNGRYSGVPSVSENVTNTNKTYNLTLNVKSNSKTKYKVLVDGEEVFESNEYSG